MTPKLAILLTALGLTVLIGFLVVSPFSKANSSIEISRRAHLTMAGDRIVTAGSIHGSTPTADIVPSPNDSSTTLEFVGDIMLARNVEQYIKLYGTEYPFAKVGDLLSNSDLLIGNFEGTVREKENIEGTNVMNFDTTPGNVSMLATQGFDLLSLSNNHADDYGRATAELTRTTITNAGMTPFGDAWEGGKFVAHKTVNGITFAFIGYHAFNETTAGIVEAIKLEKSAGNFVIVMPHWGVEYQHNPSSSQIFAGHQFVDAGADAVIGGHPHVIETVETYKNVPIVYSLGNFLFDQDFSEATKSGLAVRLTVEADKLTLKFEPLYLQKRQMMPASEEKAKQMLETLGVPTGILEISR
ncbi:MAG: CapA family protein [Patescibacteria group bacterium]|jgi:poly-gamma-glutamate synthesis protein (capsule biosynthesis protein)